MTRLLAKATHRYRESKAWDLYLAKYQHMDEKSYVPFDEFYNPKKEVNESKSADEILTDVKQLLEGNTWVA